MSKPQKRLSVPLSHQLKISTPLPFQIASNFYTIQKTVRLALRSQSFKIHRNQPQINFQTIIPTFKVEKITSKNIKIPYKISVFSNPSQNFIFTKYISLEEANESYMQKCSSSSRINIFRNPKIGQIPSITELIKYPDKKENNILWL